MATALKKSQLPDADGVVEELLVDEEKTDANDEKYHGFPLKLIQDVATRWSSTFHMLRRAFKLRLNIKDVLKAIEFRLSYPSAES